MRFAVYLARLLAAGVRLAPMIALIIAAAVVGAGLVVESGASRLALADAHIAGLERMDMLSAEHALVADFVNQRQEAQREADAAADDEVVRIKVAMAEHAAAAQRVAMLAPSENRTAPVTKLVPVTRTMAKMAKMAMSTAPRQPQAVEAPMPLIAMAEDVPAAPPRPNIVIRRVHDVVATVEQIPDWMRGAATWVVDLPGQALPRWPRRLNVSL